MRIAPDIKTFVPEYSEKDVLNVLKHLDDNDPLINSPSRFRNHFIDINFECFFVSFMYHYFYNNLTGFSEESVNRLLKIERFGDPMELVIKENDRGLMSLFTVFDIKEGTVILDFSECTLITMERELRTIELDANKHALNFWGGHTNHHCDPSCFIDKENFCMVANRDIKAGEELNFDYIDNESEISASFICNCGAPNCRGKISTDNSKPSYL